VLLSIALSGAASLGAQVIWARILGPMLGGTVYVFSIILAIFLIGLGLGAAAGSSIGRKFNARTALSCSGRAGLARSSPRRPSMRSADARSARSSP
jgi:spermidine synthase